MKKFFYIFTPLILGTLVGIFTPFKDYYASLNKPMFAPPSIIFPIVWTILFLLMGISYYILRKNTIYENDEVVIYYLQLGANLLWTFFFFTLKLKFFSIIWTVLLLILTIIMIRMFYNKNKTSAYLNIPYLIWLIFALYLTIGVYVLN